MTRPLRAAALAAVAVLAAPRAGAEPPAGGATGGIEILHMPALERRADQGILRPVPITFELPRDVALRARRVLVHYRLWGDPDWTTIELRRHGARYEGAIPCLEISTVTGDLRYHIRVHDLDGRVIASGASRANPYRVAIKNDAALAPGAKRVVKCADAADCPAGLPGCPSERVVELPCQADRDCVGGMTCSWRGVCERVDRRTRWISLSVEQDFGVIHASGACSVPAQENEGYACFRADGDQYAGNPVLTNEPLGAGRGPTRLLLGYDHLIHYDTSLGLRAGWAVAGEGPTPRGGVAFVPISVSARATHWFGEDPFARSGLRPFAFITAGYAMFDIETEIHVREDPGAIVYQGGNDLEQTLALWKRAGDGFAGPGGGVSFAFGAGAAAFVELSAVYTFSFGALVLAPSAGVMLGF